MAMKQGKDGKYSPSVLSGALRDLNTVTDTVLAEMKADLDDCYANYSDAARRWHDAKDELAEKDEELRVLRKSEVGSLRHEAWQYEERLRKAEAELRKVRQNWKDETSRSDGFQVRAEKAEASLQWHKDAHAKNRERIDELEAVKGRAEATIREQNGQILQHAEDKRRQAERIRELKEEVARQKSYAANADAEIKRLDALRKAEDDPLPSEPVVRTEADQIDAAMEQEEAEAREAEDTTDDND